MYTYIHIYIVHIYIHTYIHIYKYTNIQRYIYTHIPTQHSLLVRFVTSSIRHSFGFREKRFNSFSGIRLTDVSHPRVPRAALFFCIDYEFRN